MRCAISLFLGLFQFRLEFFVVDLQLLDLHTVRIRGGDFRDFRCLQRLDGGKFLSTDDAREIRQT